MKYEEIMERLKDISEGQEAYEEMSRLNIETENSLGVSVKNLREIAKNIEKDHALAERLWDSGLREARILASMVDEVEEVTEKQMETGSKTSIRGIYVIRFATTFSDGRSTRRGKRGNGAGETRNLSKGRVSR